MVHAFFVAVLLSQNVDGGVKRDACTQARDRVAAWKELIALRDASPDLKNAKALDSCNQLALRLADTAFTLCQPPRAADLALLDAGVNDLRARLSREQETLRRAQNQGCR